MTDNINQTHATTPETIEGEVLQEEQEPHEYMTLEDGNIEAQMNGGNMQTVTEHTEERNNKRYSLRPRTTKWQQYTFTQTEEQHAISRLKTHALKVTQLNLKDRLKYFVEKMRQFYVYSMSRVLISTDVFMCWCACATYHRVG